ncbi:peptide-methionine (R)-S-oxide reductase MsrB [Candidatus Saccharibacteria bacterium]|nr:peptide-methionine (R)-S-oxide reductase MsrB [Candidatus Saccharibacteria bacterium]
MADNENLKAKPDAFWREKLTPEQYRVMRERGTERPYTETYADNTSAGVYKCAACGNDLFSSDTKFESTAPGLAGWPAFSAELSQGKVELVEDRSLGMSRTEITCGRCGAHLGHLFTDDPASTNGMHYCVNSVALAFDPKETGKA